MPRHLRIWTLFPLIGLVGCVHVKMDPIQVHAVVDVNVKVDRAVKDLFADIYGQSTTVTTPTAQPSS